MTFRSLFSFRSLRQHSPLCFVGDITQFSQSSIDFRYRPVELEKVSMSQTNIESEAVLNITSSDFYISGLTQTIRISKSNLTVNVVSASQNTPNPVRIFGILGIIKLRLSHYLIVIKNRTEIGKLDGQIIYKISGVALYPFSEEVGNFDDHEDDVKYQNLLKGIMRLPLYYSHTLDITNTFQRRSMWTPAQAKLPMWQRCDIRFWWNRFLMSPLLEPASGSSDPSEYTAFLQPVMMGFIQVNNLTLSGQFVQLALFSRRHTRRVGTRFIVRGLDTTGAVANFVETEQVVFLPTRRQTHSFVQIRGSIPVYWSQLTTMKYTPKIAIPTDKKPDAAFIAHFQELADIYGQNGPFICTSLINLKGAELKLAEAFQGVVERTKVPGVEYHAFDFHKECPGTKFEAIDKLYLKIKASMDIIAWFMSDGSHHVESPEYVPGTVLRYQQGILRVNCVDNLDRTNVGQSVFAKHVLMQQLQILGIADNIQTDISFFPELKQAFQLMWADNADAISSQYAGTGALKTDFTRTGKRSIFGMLQDGYKSLKRYYLNNFTDGIKQDGFNLFLGIYKVDPTKPSPFDADKGREQLITLLLLLFGLLFILGLSNIVTSNKGVLAAYWTGFLGSYVVGLYFKGSKLVNIPVLTRTFKKD